MGKAVLGIDIGHDQMKMALVKNGKVIKTAVEQMPENLLKDGRITSRETISEMIKTTMKVNGIHAGMASVVLPNDVVFVKNVTMPMMSVDQLLYNLPFEFNDYITGEVKDYVFDYAVTSESVEDTEKGGSKRKKKGTKAGDSGDTQGEGSQSEDSDGDSVEAPKTLELMGVGTLRAVLEDLQVSLHRAGLRMIRTAPPVSAYIGLLRRQHESLGVESGEYALLDLGYKEIRMYMFKGDKHVATRLLEIGMSSLDSILEDVYGVDVHLAHTYLMSNYENCHQRDECVTAYENIAVELMRALNFYHFSNPNSVLGDMWLCGGGALILPLAETIGDTLDIRLHSADELVPGGDRIELCNSFVQAIGIAMG